MTKHNNTTTVLQAPPRAFRNLRRLAPHTLNTLIRRSGLNHFIIAKSAGVSEPVVHYAIYRKRRGPAVTRVWAELEKRLNGGAA